MWRPLALALICTLILSACIPPPPPPPPPPSPEASPTPRPLPTPINLSNEQIADKLRPSTVLVRAKFPATAIADEGEGFGTGIVYDSEHGYILTAAHVVEGATTVKVFMAGSTRAFSARTIGRAQCEDLALLQIEPVTEMTAAQFGDSATTKVGADVVALGFPRALGTDGPGADIAVSPGTLSRMDVAEPPYSNLLQMTAVLEHGNSGGPLVNRRGEVIGINVLSFGLKGNGASSYYAIPINHAQRFIRDLAEGRNRYYTGMNLRPNSFKSYFGTAEGMVVIGVEDGSPADEAGLQPADLLLKLGGGSVNTEGDICDILGSEDGGQLGVVVLRGKVGQQERCEGDLRLGKVTSGAPTQLRCVPLGEPSGTGEVPGTLNCASTANLEIVVCDDFSGDDNGSWPVGEKAGDYKASVRNEHYTISSFEAQTVTANPGTAVGDIGDGAIEAYVRLENTGWAGLFGRYTNDGGNKYACWIDNNRRFGCYKTVDGVETTLIRTATSDAIRPGAYNAMLLIILGNELFLEINGTDVASIIDDSLVSGTWGVFIGTDDTNFTGHFDNIRIARTR